MKYQELYEMPGTLYGRYHQNSTILRTEGTSAKPSVNTDGEPCDVNNVTHGSGSSMGETQVKLCAPVLTSHREGEETRSSNDEKVRLALTLL